MRTNSISLITVSREFGAGGSDLASELGSRLKWPVLDHDIVHRVAERLRLDDGTVEPFDEHPPSLLARIATVLIVPLPGMYSFPAADDVPSHDAIAGATRRVIEDAAKSLPLIVVGHGAQCIFEDWTDTLSVRLVAPLTDSLCAQANQWNYTDPRGFAWVNGEFRCALYNHYMTPNSATFDCMGVLGSGDIQVRLAPYGWRAARSNHPGGVNVAMADGSGRFFGNEVDATVWKMLSTIAGAETGESP